MEQNTFSLHLKIKKEAQNTNMSGTFGPDINFQALSEQRCQEIQQGFKEKFSKKTKMDEAPIRDCNVPISDGAADTLRRLARLEACVDRDIARDINFGPQLPRTRLLKKKDYQLVREFKYLNEALCYKAKVKARYEAKLQAAEPKLDYKNCVPCCQYCSRLGHSEEVCKKNPCNKRNKPKEEQKSSVFVKPASTEEKIQALSGKKNRQQREEMRNLKKEKQKETKVKAFKKMNYDNRQKFSS